uniref:TPS29 n=1 Tax=Juglans sigillata TaxID=224355 RepID=A0A8K1B134_9ROSI|nr:TPS29 [Juglans sigillata]
MKSEAFNLIHQRRSANYEPNIWKCDFLESLDSIYDEPECKKRAEKLIEDVRSVIFGKAVELDSLAKTLELIDSLEKLGLAIHFEVEIKEALASIAISIKQKNGNLNGEDDLYATALCFKLLRQHGYDVSQDMFSNFMDAKTGAFIRKSKHENIKGMLELLEASHLAIEGENFLDKAREFSTTTLEETLANLDGFHAKQVIHALELPSRKRVKWFDVKWHISVEEKHRDMNAINLLELAKLNFNIVQATLQKDLRELSRWWRNLGLIENLNFARDRLVESFVCSVGLACEPEHSGFRKWLTKAINFILIIDDVYDVYGLLEELELFTIAVNMWDVSETKMLPECMQICFLALYNTTDDFVNEIQREKGWDQSLPVHVKKVWTDFCNALYVEAKWYTTGYTPSLQEYLSNAWISSSGTVLFAHAFFCLEHKVMKAEEYKNFMEKSKDLLYNISVIVRLCNDLGTSSAEVERGDSPSSIVCYMREKNVSEERARKHIKGMIDESWKKLNGECLTQMPMQLMQTFVNIARVVEGLYHQGDWFGVQDGDKRNKMIKSLLLEPLSC